MNGSKSIFMNKSLFLIFTTLFLLSHNLVFCQWNSETCDIENGIYSISMMNDSVGLIAGYGICRYDGNGHWYQVSNVGTQNMVMADSLFGWCRSGYSIKKTTDGGYTWDVMYTNEYLGYSSSISCIDSMHCWALSPYEDMYGQYENVLIITHDGGLSWEENLYVGYNGANVLFKDVNNGWVFTLDIIYVTQNGGYTWQQYNNPIDGRYFHFIDTLNGWLVGLWDGIIANTVDGGVNWNLQYQDINETYLNDVYFLDQNYGYVLGNRWDTTIIFITNDGGVSWDEQSILCEGGIGHEIIFTDSITGWIVGGWNEGQVLLHTENGGIVWMDDFSAYQSTINIFPNPVTTTTNISIEISTREDISLSLFDVNGHIKKKIFSGVKSLGKHRLEIDCSYLPNGIYLVKLQSAKEVHTKKLVVK